MPHTSPRRIGLAHRASPASPDRKQTAWGQRGDQGREIPSLAPLYLAMLKRSLLDTASPTTLQRNPPTVHNDALGLTALEHEWFHLALPTPRQRCLDHLHACLEECLAVGVEGDWVACGACYSGAAVLMRGVLAAHGVGDRTVWVADTFAGLPPTGSSEDPPTLPEPARHRIINLRTALRLFAVYGLLDRQVRFLPGELADTLPRSPLTHVAVLCLDDHLYDQDALDALETLYPKVSPDGYVVVNSWDEGRAVARYRQIHGLTDEMTILDAHCATWRKHS